jgi:hypothetical protein
MKDVFVIIHQLCDYSPTYSPLCTYPILDVIYLYSHTMYFIFICNVLLI